MSLDENLEVVRRIVNCVDVPISADLETGYSDRPEAVADAARRALEVGAVGINLEDGTGNPTAPLCEESIHVEKIQGVREMAQAMGIPLVINARTDVCLVSDEQPANRLRATIKRAEAYRQAGADCIFVPDTGNLDREAISHLVKEIDAPLNIIAGGNTPPLGDLEEIGVARVSFGPRPMRVMLASLRGMAREWLSAGTYSKMLVDSLTYAEVNGMFSSESHDSR